MQLGVAVSMPVSPRNIQGMLTAFWMSKTLFTGVELGVFDELAKGPASAEVLAYRLRLHPGALERLMNALVALELIQKENGRFSNTEEAALYLVKGQQGYLGAQVEHLSQLHWRLWQLLPGAIRENTPRVKEVFGPGFDMLAAVYAEPRQLRGFVQGMHNLTVPDAQEIVDAVDFTPYHTLLDVGGTSGALVIAALRRYQHLSGIVFEQPAVCAIADDYLRQYGVDDRARTHPGDFFEAGSLPTEADVIALGWILHDWPDEQCHVILRHCYEALQPGGAILVCEKLLDEQGTGPLLTTLMDLHALVSTGGQERSANVYVQWLEQAGFQDVDVRILEGNRDLVTGRKP